MKKLNNFDYVEFQITRIENQQISYPFSKAIIKGHLNIDLKPVLNEMLLSKEYDEKTNLLVIEKKEEKKKIKYEIKLIKHTEPKPVIKKLLNQIVVLEKQNHSLEEQNSNLLNQNQKQKDEYLAMQNDFKNQIEILQNKAQQTINDHKQKNSEHFDEQLKKAKEYALQKFLEEILNPLNNIEIAIKAALNMDNPAVKNFAIGFNMLYQQIDQILNDFQVSKIIPKEGDVFDPNIHQVYELVESDLAKDIIIQVKNIGYKLHDRVIKPALVIVSK
ncbi:nucleotide exchange factor GrpE [[Mycoplasma] anseris]|uniref:Protein GrpE n=1 Tax=[Mycoplasma] anseris TaxID=92400 RepID=A0A2Z4NDC8_9BACT|nr:nucleotide exchange factor GrpE [[Mycoplasma] anseris]AWX69592.1 nucleotide exchange factor GrpE [[Mycoplasma] anseris]